VTISAVRARETPKTPEYIFTPDGFPASAGAGRPHLQCRARCRRRRRRGQDRFWPKGTLP
jgi:hypothetical protein